MESRSWFTRDRLGESIMAPIATGDITGGASGMKWNATERRLSLPPMGAVSTTGRAIHLQLLITRGGDTDGCFLARKGRASPEKFKNTTL